MRYADIYECEISNGRSVGQSLFVQGCHFHCKGCFNSQTWDFEKGREWNSKTENIFLELAERPYIKRITILGGEPLCDENINDVLVLIRKLKDKYPDKQIWVYTGYTIEELEEKILSLKDIDVLIDGRFEADKKDLTLTFRGSGNQRLIDLRETLRNYSSQKSITEQLVLLEGD